MTTLTNLVKSMTILVKLSPFSSTKIEELAAWPDEKHIRERGQINESKLYGDHALQGF